jgi:endonuclease YncB( thermonuclease family)
MCETAHCLIKSVLSVSHGRVVGVTDGDTIKVLVAGEQLLRIRLAFCDASEKKQAFGARAKRAMSELVFARDTELRTQAIDRPISLKISHSGSWL